MASLWDKFRTFSLSNLHSLLDAAIDLNSVEAVKQHVRDLEDALRTLRGGLAASTGNTVGLKSRVAALSTKIQTTTENIELILTDDDPGNDHFAEKLGATIVDLQAELEAVTEEFQAAEAEQSALARAEEQLQAKVSEMQGHVRRLVSLQRATEAKSRAAASITAATEALGEGTSVDNIEQRIRAQAGTADAALGQAMGDLDSAGGAGAAVRKSQASSVVAQIKARLAAQKAGATT